MLISVIVHSGLGNKLFQIAMLMGLSKKIDDARIVIDVNQLYRVAFHQKVDLKYFIRGLEGEFPITPTTKKICERFQDCGKYIEYDVEGNDSVLFEGYFQSEKYFQHIEPLIHQQFGPTTEALEYLFKKYKDLATGFFVHVRRGDYINHPKHDLALYENTYFHRAVNCFADIECKTMFVCSDDLPWCRQQPLFQAAIFVDENEMLTLWMMASCKYGGVASNSTFSWWGLYLNQSPHKKAIFPDRIHNDQTISMEDFYPPHCTILPVKI